MSFNFPLWILAVCLGSKLKYFVVIQSAVSLNLNEACAIDSGYLAAVYQYKKLTYEEIRHINNVDYDYSSLQTNHKVAGLFAVNYWPDLGANSYAS